MGDALGDARDLLERLGTYEAAFDLAADAAPVITALCEELDRRGPVAQPAPAPRSAPGAGRPMSAAVPVANLFAWARCVDDEIDLDATAAAIRGWAGDPDADVESIRYEALTDGAGPIECPECAGSGDDVRHEGTCTLCAGAGEVDGPALLGLAGRLDELHTALGDTLREWLECADPEARRRQLRAVLLECSPYPLVDPATALLYVRSHPED